MISVGLALMGALLFPSTAFSQVATPSVAGGTYHSVALNSSGRVLAWGDNGFGQGSVPVAAQSGVSAVSTLAYHNLAVKFDGTVVAWGYDAYGQVSLIPGGLSGVVAVSAGIFHSLAAKSDGTVVAWGYNSDGQTNVPGGLSGVVAVAGGYLHSLALKSDGSVVAWGNPTYATVPVAAQSGVVAIAASLYHSLALKSDGTVVAWGSNGDGQISVPGGLSGVTSIAAGWYHSVAGKSDGTIVAWGYNGSGQVSPIPGGLSGVAVVAAGYEHTLALKFDGTIVGWGYNANGQSTAPTGLDLNGTVLDAGLFHSLALKSNGTPLAWGINDNNQTTLPAGLSSAVDISGGFYHSLSVTSDGTIVAWGRNTEGQVAGVTGLGGTDVSATVCAGHPAYPFVGGNHCSAATVAGTRSVSAGGYHSLALNSDGTVMAWGYNAYNQVFGMNGLTGIAAVAAGGYQSLALRLNGTVVYAGYDGGYGVPAWAAGLSGVKAVASGTYLLNLALKSDGTVTAAGYDPSNVIGGAAAVTDAVAIAVGDYFAVALKSDGTVVAWGDNSNGQSTVPAGLTGVVAIAAGALHAVALKSDGTLVSWGYNGYGQTSVAGLNLDGTAPAVPLGLTTNAISATQINLAWNAAIDNPAPGVSSGVAFYQVYRGGVSQGTTAATSFSDTGLTGATTYNYTVATCDTAGNCSAQSSATPGTTNTPASPGGLGTTAITATQIDLTWTAAAGATAYGVYRDGVLRTTTAATTYSDTGLNGATAYTYLVYACVGNACSAPSTISPTTTTPAAPGTVTPTVVSPTQIDVTWSAVGGAVSYQVYRDGVQVGTTNAATLTFSHTALNAATTYNLAIATCGTNACSAPSVAVQATTQTPAAPGTVTPTVVSTTQIDVTWTAVAGAVNYQVYRDGVQVGTTNAATLTFSHTGLNAATTYNLAIATCGTNACSAPSVAVPATTQMPAAPGTVTPTVVSPTQIDVTWSAVAGAVSYQVYRDGVFINTVNAPTVTFSHTGLTAATNYNFSIATCGTNACSAPTVAVPATTQTPAAPGTVTPTVVSPTQIDVAWSAVAGAASYQVYRDGAFINTVNAPTVTFSHTGLTGATTYNFSIATCGTNACSAPSAPVSATTSTPATPTGLTATPASQSQINLSWNASVGAINYQIYRGGALHTTVGTTSFNDTGLAASTTYDYTVTACGTNTCSAQSAQVSATTPDTDAPTQPGQATLTAVASNNQIDLTWSASTDNVAVVEYRIYRSVSGGPYNFLTSVSALPLAGTYSYSDTGLTAVTMYSYVIEACDAVPNCSVQSSAAIATTPDNVPPTVPGLATLTATASANQIALTWSASTDNVGVTEYQVFRDGVFQASVNAAPLAGTYGYTDTGLTASTMYSYVITACDAAGNCSVQSAAAIATTPDNVVPNVPAAPTITNLAANTLRVNWLDPGDNAGGGVTLYKVFRDGVQIATVNAPTLFFDDSGLITVTAYSYSVAACDAAGNCSVPSAPTGVTTLDNVPPTVPTAVNITNLGGNTLTVNWTGSTDNVGVTEYQVFRGGALIGTTNAATLSFDDSGLVSATLYVYTVAACDLAGNCSAQSAPAPVITLDNVPPTVPGALTATAVTQSQINLAWNVSTDNVGVFSYGIYRDSVLVQTIGAPANSYNDTGLAASTTYTYAVTACDAAGNCSLQSNTASATTPDTEAPTVPTGLTATGVSTSQINVAWTASTDNVAVTAYGVYRAGVFIATVNAPTLAYGNGGLATATSYTYTVNACDAAGNCSAQSASVTGTTYSVFTQNVQGAPAGLFNQIGNVLDSALDVVAVFGNQDATTAITANVISLWKWNPATDKWAFYSPDLTAAGNDAYVLANNYELLTTINGGEGYWINARATFGLPPQAGALFSYNGTNFTAIAPGGTSNLGWYLIATSDTLTPAQFNIQVSPTPPGPGVVPVNNFLSLWAWDYTSSKWFFYAPLLEDAGGLAAVKAYADANGFQHFEDFAKTLGPGAGFWVNRP